MGLSGRRSSPLACLPRAPGSFLHPFLPSACYAGYDDEEDDDDDDDDDDVMILCKNERSRHHDNDKFGLKVMIT